MWRAVVIVGVAIAECFRVTAAQLSKAPPWYDAGIPWWLAFPPEKEINAHYKNSKPLVGSRTLPIHPDQHTALLRAGHHIYPGPTMPLPSVLNPLPGHLPADPPQQDPLFTALHDIPTGARTAPRAPSKLGINLLEPKHTVTPNTLYHRLLKETSPKKLA